MDSAVGPTFREGGWAVAPILPGVGTSRNLNCAVPSRAQIFHLHRWSFTRTRAMLAVSISAEAAPLPLALGG